MSSQQEILSQQLRERVQWRIFWMCASCMGAFCASVMAGLNPSSASIVFFVLLTANTVRYMWVLSPIVFCDCVLRDEQCDDVE